MAMSNGAKAGLAAVGIAAAAGIGYLVLSGKSSSGPTITSSASSVSYTVNDILGITTGDSFTPTTLTITGTGFTKEGSIKCFWNGSDVTAYTSSSGDWLAGNPTAGSTGLVTITLTLNGLEATIGTASLQCLDVTSTKYSNSVSIVVANSNGGTTPPTSTNAPENVLTSWNSTGTYGYNTNPVAFGNWYLGGNSYQFSYGPGYYVTNASPPTEVYFATSADMGAWLTTAGLITQVGSNQQNPFSAGSSYQGSGGAWYVNWSSLSLGTTSWFINTTAGYQNWLAYGTPTIPVGYAPSNPYPANSNGTQTWQGSGYYIFPIAFNGLPANYVQNVTSQAYITAYNSLVSESQGANVTIILQNSGIVGTYTISNGTSGTISGPGSSEVNLPNGTYTITMGANGYNTISNTVTVASNNPTITFDLGLTSTGGGGPTSSGPKLSVSPSSIPMQNGATCTFTGTNFSDNGSGNIVTIQGSQTGITVASFTADGNGNFTVTCTYTGFTNTTNGSGLYTAIAQATSGSTYISLTAYDYGSGTYSNNVNLAF